MAKKKTEVSERASLRRRRRLRQLLGAVVCVLVVIGLLSTVSGSVKMVGRLFDDTEEKLAFAARLEYLVALDPLPFDTISDASMGTLLDAAIWTTISGTNSDDYEHDEVGAMYLPTADIDKIVTALYGPDIKFNYATFEDRGLTFNYIPEKQAYLIPVTSAPTDYKPVVEKIKREGKTKRVTVGYDSPYDESDLPVKYNDYIFARNADDGQYYLTGIVASDMKAADSAISSSTVPTADSTPLDTENALGDVGADLLPEGTPAPDTVSQETAPQEAAAGDGTEGAAEGEGDAAADAASSAA